MKEFIEEIKKYFGKEKITVEDIMKYKEYKEKEVEKKASEFFKPHLKNLFSKN